MKAIIEIDLSLLPATPETDVAYLLRQLADKVADQGLPNTCYLLQDFDKRVVGQMEVQP